MSNIDTIKGAITIPVKPKLVFKVIMDFDRYRQWNPWIQSRGQSTTEDTLYFEAKHAGVGTVRHQLVKVVEPESVCWNIASWQRHFVQTTREISIYPASDNSAIVTLKISFSGPALLFATLLFKRHVRKQAMAELVALKQRCEALVSAKH